MASSRSEKLNKILLFGVVPALVVVIVIVGILLATREDPKEEPPKRFGPGEDFDKAAGVYVEGRRLLDAASSDEEYRGAWAKIEEAIRKGWEAIQKEVDRCAPVNPMSDPKDYSEFKELCRWADDILRTQPEYLEALELVRKGDEILSRWKEAEDPATRARLGREARGLYGDALDLMDQVLDRYVDPPVYRLYSGKMRELQEKRVMLMKSSTQ